MQVILPQISSYGGTSVVNITATGGVSPYTGTGTFNLPASYSYPVIDANGCLDSVSFTIIEPDSLQLIINATPILCNGDSSVVTLSALGGIAPYNGLGTFNVASFTYTSNITDSNGNFASGTITISQPSQLLANANPSVLSCFGDTSTVVVNASGGVILYWYRNFYETAGKYNKI